MSKYLMIAAGLIAGVGVVWTAPAEAHGDVQWSMSIGGGGYYQPPGVTVYPQPQYPYGAPPSAFAPPPVIYYNYTMPQPVYQYYYPQPSARLNVNPYGYQGNRHQDYRPNWQYDGSRSGNNWNQRR